MNTGTASIVWAPFCYNMCLHEEQEERVHHIAAERAAIKAGKLLLDEIHRLSRGKEDFAFETTLAGKSYAPFIKDLKRKGFRVHLFFLWIPSVDLALMRVRQRVAQGGHSIPEPDVRRRFKRGLVNLFDVYRPLFDVWSIFDNATDTPRLVAEGVDGQMNVVDESLYKRIRKGAR